MKHYDLLKDKRRHVISYKKDVPPKEIIDNALEKALRTTSSKNNMFAYRINVYGPEQQEWKEKIWTLSNRNHIEVDKDTNALGLSKVTHDAKKNPNPNYNHVRTNPYLFAFHSRVVHKPNAFYQMQIDNGSHTADEMYPEYVNKIIDHIALEVGMFATNLSSYLLEEGLDVSYNICFIRDVKQWHDLGFTWVKRRPILMMSCGYAEETRQQWLEKKGKLGLDTCPPLTDIVSWVK